MPGSVIQEVYRLANTAAATAKFELYGSTEFGKSNHVPSSEFISPPEVIYRSPIADQFDLRCGVELVPICRVILQYGSCFVYFHINVDSWLWYGLEETGDGLAVEDIETILIAMDELIASQLQIPLTRSRSSFDLDLDEANILPPTPPASVPDLERALSSADPQVRIGAAYMLALKPEEAREALPALITNLEHPMADVRFAALWALEALGTSADDAIPMVSDVLQNDEVFQVHNQAAIVLGRIGGSAGAGALALALYDEELAVQRNAAEALEKLAGEDFPSLASNGSAFTADGELAIVVAAREWWTREGQYESRPR